MNVKEYIESGILEAYALGALTEIERNEVEANIAMYPELATELAAIEEGMFQYAEEHSVAPPPSMQNQIWDAIKADDDSIVNEAPQEEAPKNVPLPPSAGGAKRPGWQMAAMWAAIIVSVLSNFILLSQRNATKEEQKVLASKIDSMSAQQQQLASVIEAYKHEKDMLADPGMETIVMRKEGEPDMAGMVYWSKDKGEAFLALHNIPKLPEGKQYQLWVIKDGAPVDMGVIPHNMLTEDGAMMKIANNVTAGQAFAISIEKEGGNPTPTEVYMVGLAAS